MMIKDLFSHKIHSSSEDWPNKLIDIASIFLEFDGKPYDRKAIEIRLSEISSRVSAVARDPSKFRDEISAYPAYLGLYRVELVDDKWHMFLSHTAKQFLITEEPNVSAFMLLQMILFQYPNGMGIAYSKSHTARLQANTRDRTLHFIRNNVHLSPFRLICMGLKADSILRGISPLDATLTFDEVFILANNSATNTVSCPSIDNVKDVLISYRKGEIQIEEKYENRFHILKHTNFLISDRTGIRIREGISKIDKEDLLSKFDQINSITNQFSGFDNVVNDEELLAKVYECSWGKYFDGVHTLGSEIVNFLTSDNPTIYSELKVDAKFPDNVEIKKPEQTYEFRKFDFLNHQKKNKAGKKIIYVDPELTKIRRQRANLNHKILLEKLHNYLAKHGITPLENPHIDMFVELPSQEKYIFEVKSITTDNLLSQTRKGISQLYEYRYRYQNKIGYDVNLFLVYPYEPNEITWLQKYLCTDRYIGVIWFNENDQIQFSDMCSSMVTPLLHKKMV